jgi:hypothetical protein
MQLGVDGRAGRLRGGRIACRLACGADPKCIGGAGGKSTFYVVHSKAAAENTHLFTFRYQDKGMASFL